MTPCELQSHLNYKAVYEMRPWPRAVSRNGLWAERSPPTWMYLSRQSHGKTEGSDETYARLMKHPSEIRPVHNMKVRHVNADLIYSTCI